MIHCNNSYVNMLSLSQSIFLYRFKNFSILTDYLSPVLNSNFFVLLYNFTKRLILTIDFGNHREPFFFFLY